MSAKTALYITYLCLCGLAPMAVRLLFVHGYEAGGGLVAGCCVIAAYVIGRFSESAKAGK
jgi:hypothetical protein